VSNLDSERFYMGIALHSFTGLFNRFLQSPALASVQVSNGPAVAKRDTESSRLHRSFHCMPAARQGHFPVRREAHNPPMQRPLRVLQITDPVNPRGVMGRLVISGRMADVCAELERLSQREAVVPPL
jgi:hypothetical protein